MPTTLGTGALLPPTTTRTTATLSCPSSRTTAREHVTIDEVFDAYHDCRRHKRWSVGAVEFELDYELGCYGLYRELNAMTYKPGPSTAFCVPRPRLREVFAAGFRDRIVHHLLILRINGVIENRLGDCAVACRKGKGVVYGVRRLKQMLDAEPDGWLARCDIEGFFMSIDKSLLMPLVEDVVREACTTDTDWWLWLARVIVMHRPELDCVVRGNADLWRLLPDNKTLFKTGGRGLPIGNLPSQVLANLYMAAFDEWATQQLGGGVRYVRYADDFVMVHPDKRHLLRTLGLARQWLEEHRHLKLHRRKVVVQPVCRGVAFTGSFIKGGIVHVGRRQRTGAMLLAGEWSRKPEHTDDERRRLCVRYNSYCGLLRQGASYFLRRTMWRRLGDYKGIININNIKIKNKKQ